MTFARAAISAFNLAFQVTPIILKGGIASKINGQLLPFIALTGELAAFGQATLLDGKKDFSDSFFAKFVPMPGGSVIANAVGEYPFLSQQIAGNAQVLQPTNISLKMIAPTNVKGGMLTKLGICNSIFTAVQNHITSGGLFHVATPAFVYLNCVLLRITDITPEEEQQKQIIWQWDFEKVLVDQMDGINAYNGLLSKISGGNEVKNTSWSGITASPLAASGELISRAIAQIPDFPFQ